MKKPFSILVIVLILFSLSTNLMAEDNSEVLYTAYQRLGSGGIFNTSAYSYDLDNGGIWKGSLSTFSPTFVYNMITRYPSNFTMTMSSHLGYALGGSYSKIDDDTEDEYNLSEYNVKFDASLIFGFGYIFHQSDSLSIALLAGPSIKARLYMVESYESGALSFIDMFFGGFIATDFDIKFSSGFIMALQPFVSYSPVSIVGSADYGKSMNFGYGLSVLFQIAQRDYTVAEQEAARRQIFGES